MVVNHPGPSGPVAPASFLVSSDRRDWTPIASNNQFAGGGDLVLLPDGSVRYFNALAGGIVSFISHDGGQTWTQQTGLRLFRRRQRLCSGVGPTVRQLEAGLQMERKSAVLEATSGRRYIRFPGEA